MKNLKALKRVKATNGSGRKAGKPSRPMPEVDTDEQSDPSACQKMKFGSQALATNFLMLAHMDIRMKEDAKPPVAAYYHDVCEAWHVTTHRHWEYEQRKMEFLRTKWQQREEKRLNREEEPSSQSETTAGDRP